MPRCLASTDADMLSSGLLVATSSSGSAASTVAGALKQGRATRDVPGAGRSSAGAPLGNTTPDNRIAPCRAHPQGHSGRPGIPADQLGAILADQWKNTSGSVPLHAASVVQSVIQKMGPTPLMSRTVPAVRHRWGCDPGRVQRGRSATVICREPATSGSTAGMPRPDIAIYQIVLTGYMHVGK